MSEMFSPERVIAVCRDYGLEPGQAMDLKNGYDFDLAADRQKNMGIGIERQANACHWFPAVHVLFTIAGIT